MSEQNKKKAIIVYGIIVAAMGLSIGLSDNLFANYFRDAFQVDAVQRGFLELPRELPGVLSVIAISGLAFLGDKKLAVIAHLLSFTGIMMLAISNPSFNVMMIWLFIGSFGVHMFIPLYDSIAMSLASDGNYGKALGMFASVRTGFSMIAGIMAFLGFRSGFFSFTEPVIINFVIAALMFLGSAILTVYLIKLDDGPRSKDEIEGNSHFVFKKEYMKFYALALLFGGRKQIIFVYGPWVLIELLNFGADYIALMIIIGSAIGIFVVPMVGKWVDKLGTGRVMVVEVLTYLLVYLGYGAISIGITNGSMVVGTTSVLVFAIVVSMIDRLILNFGMVRSIYVRSIALDEGDVTPTIAAGLALDHMSSIPLAVLSGWIWWEFGPYWVFVLATIMALVQLVVAVDIAKGQKASDNM